MRFYFPDSQDQIDPNFDFEREEHPPHRARQRDDLYAHEAQRAGEHGDPCDGVGRYTMAQRHRLQRVGVREFFRLDRISGQRIETLGIAALSYVDEPEPLYTVEEVIEFYRSSSSMPGSRSITSSRDSRRLTITPSGFDGALRTVRQEITIDLAERFLLRWEAAAAVPTRRRRAGVEPQSALVATALQDMGYRRVEAGGLVGLKTPEILQVLRAAHEIARPDVEFHLRRDSHGPGPAVLRRDEHRQHARSASPSRTTRTTTTGWIATTWPCASPGRWERESQAPDQVREVDREAQRLSGVPNGVRAFARGDTVAPVLDALHEYQQLYGARRITRTPRRLSRPVLGSNAPARSARAGVEVVLFRGSERNKRRGFHNLWVFNNASSARCESSPSSRACQTVAEPEGGRACRNR